MLFFASMLDLLKIDEKVIVVGVDIELTDSAKTLFWHNRIRLIEGSSTDPEVVDKVRNLLPKGKGLIVLDSDHSRQHVLNEINIYKEFLEKGGYLVVEDTNVNANPVCPNHGPGPMEAVNDFLSTPNDFVRDDALWQQQLFSFHQYGWLKKIRT